ncbi:hypothetical protein GF407_04780 [candidate division KSB1 bacterium]|nr:hypothetical protein [candidate division KSB1 bacterium]
MNPYNPYNPFNSRFFSFPAFGWECLRAALPLNHENWGMIPNSFDLACFYGRIGGRVGLGAFKHPGMRYRATPGV